MLSCFAAITDIDSKEILVAVQQGMNFLSPEEINKLTDVESIKKLDKNKINELSKRLENALREFDEIRNNYKQEDKGKSKSNDYNEDDDYKKAHPSHGNKLGKFMKGMTNILKVINNFGKIIIAVIVIYFVSFIIKSKRSKNEYYNYKKTEVNNKSRKKKKN